MLLIKVMKQSFTRFLLAAVLLMLAAGTATAEELTVQSILVAHRAGASDRGIVALINDPANSVSATVADMAALRAAGLSETVLQAIEARVATAAGSPAATAPPAAPVAPAELSFDLVLERSGLRRNRTGRLVLRGDSLAWVDAEESGKNFEFKVAGLEKVWFTCQARTPENFCYQVNFQIVQGARYQFQDVNRESGSNASVLEVMEALRRYFPQVAFGAPDTTKG